MPDRPTATLRIEPDMLPGLIATYGRALDGLTPMLDDLQHRGRIPEPWAKDPASQLIAEHFNTHAVDGPRSAYAMLRLYEQELVRVHQTLIRMDLDYRRTEDDNASRMAQL